MLGNSSGYWSPNSDFEDVEVLWPEPKRFVVNSLEIQEIFLWFTYILREITFCEEKTSKTVINEFIGNFSRLKFTKIKISNVYNIQNS